MDNENGIWNRLNKNLKSKLTMGFPKNSLVIYMSVTSKLCLLRGFITVKFNTYYIILYLKKLSTVPVSYEFL